MKNLGSVNHVKIVQNSQSDPKVAVFKVAGLQNFAAAGLKKFQGFMVPILDQGSRVPLF